MSAREHLRDEERPETVGTLLLNESGYPRDLRESHESHGSCEPWGELQSLRDELSKTQTALREAMKTIDDLNEMYKEMESDNELLRQSLKLLTGLI